MNAPREHYPTPWHIDTGFGGWWEVMSATGDVVFKEADKVEAERIVACVNACKDIPTSALTALEWQLAIKGAATPEQVARLLLKLNEYRDMMAKLVDQAERCNFIDEYGHLLTMNTAYQAIEEALK